MKKVEINQAVANDYDRYRQIQSDQKQIAKPTFELHTTKTHLKNQSGDVPVSFKEMDEKAHLNVDLNVERTKSFKFRLVCESFMETPCYRFDSDGKTHENPPAPTRTLKDRIVPTPHFHCFDDQGRNLAYRTEALKANEEAFLSDSCEALKLFCEEENIRLAAEPSFLQETLPIGTPALDDPLEGVEFP